MQWNCPWALPGSLCPHHVGVHACLAPLWTALPWKEEDAEGAGVRVCRIVPLLPLVADRFNGSSGVMHWVRNSFKVARLQSEFGAKHFLSYEFPHEKCSETLPEVAANILIIEFFRGHPRAGDNFTSLLQVLQTLYTKRQKHPCLP